MLKGDLEMKSIAAFVLGLSLLGGDHEKESKCPISGKPGKEDIFLEVNGRKVNFCCDKCPKVYEKKLGLVDGGPKTCPISKKEAKAETRLIHAKAEMVYFCCGNCPKKYLEKEKLEAVDKGPAKCPLCDMKAKEANSLIVNGETLYFCSEGCQKGFLKMMGVVDKGPAKCPISGGAAKKDFAMVRVKSEAVYFCCNDCKKQYVEKNFPAKKGE